MRPGPAALVLSAAILEAAHAGETLALSPPAFLAGPQVSHSALGATYAYHGRASHPQAALQVTVVHVPAELAGSGGRTSERCLELFVGELKRGRAGFVAAPATEPLQAAGLTFAQVRWLDTSANGATGVMSCTVDGERYIAIGYQDSLKGAVESFPKIRASLKRLAIPR